MTAPSLALARRFAPAAAAFLAATAAPAQTRSDEALWLMLFGTGQLGAPGSALEDLEWWLDLQPRFRDDSGGLDQLLVRPGAGYRIADEASAWLGYAWIQQDLPGPGDAEENRIWQQFLWTPRVGELVLQSRTRLEQRWLSTGDDVGWRFRQFVKATLPLGDGPLYLSGWEEVFLDCNDTDWGQRAGFSQNRLFAGLGWRLAAGRNLEVGYLNQLLYRRSAVDDVVHIMSINLLLTF